MFCDACGAQVQPDQKFCANCGKAFATAPGAYTVPPPVVPENRLRRHIHILSILWIVYAGLQFLAGGVLFSFSHMVWPGFRPPEFPEGMHGFVGRIIGMLSVLILAKGLAGLIAAFGLIQRQPWARILTLVVGFLSLLNLPFGTALGIYTIWVLLARDADREYDAYVAGQ